MAFSSCPFVVFSDDGSQIAYCGSEASLKIWDTETGTLKQEYVPTSHLSSMCTCLSWMPKNSHNKSHKKKRKSEVATDVFEKSVAMGTLKGNILIYSVSLGDLQSELTDGHTDSVNDIQWNLSQKQMFSCSHDGHVVKWDLKKGRPKSKWRAEKGIVSKMALSENGETLFTAGKTIQWWDVENERLLKKFTGHATQIIQLKLLHFHGESFENGYAVSAAAADRSLSVWSLKSKSRSALASCSLEDEPLTFDVYSPQSRSENVLITSVSKNGVLQIFEQQLNGKKSPPQESRATVRIADDSDNKPRQLKILSCHLNNGKLTIAYDNNLKLCSETLDLSTLKSDVCLVRSSTSSTTDTAHSKLKIQAPDTKDTQVSMAFSTLAPNLPTQTEGKRKLGTDKIVAMPMDKRLSTLRLDVHLGEDSQVSAQNVVHLLMQGLHSSDQKMLDQVFICQKMETIEKTVRRLPVEVVLPLIKELQTRIIKRRSSPHLLAWIKFILLIHSSYLGTCTNLHGFLIPIYNALDVKFNAFRKMSQLKGKLDVLISKASNSEELDPSLGLPAVLSYQDESSEDELLSDPEFEEILKNKSGQDDMDYLDESGDEDDRNGECDINGDESMEEDQSD